MAPGVVFREFGNAVLNDAGMTAFRGRLAGPGTSENSSWAAWSEGGGALHSLARAGQPAPFVGFFSDNIVTPQLNNLGQSFFWADVADGILYSEVGGAIIVLATGGMQAAGIGRHLPPDLGRIPDLSGQRPGAVPLRDDVNRPRRC